MAHLKENGQAGLANISTVGQTWKRLPDHVKERMEGRLTAMRCV